MGANSTALERVEKSALVEGFCCNMGDMNYPCVCMCRRTKLPGSREMVRVHSERVREIGSR